MGQLGTLDPYTVHKNVPADSIIGNADEWLFWRAPNACQVTGAYLVNNATIAGVTDTVRVEIGKKAAGTGSFTQIADFPAATVKTADTPVTGTLTATTASTKLAAGDWLALKKTIAGTGATSGLAIVVNVIDGYQN